MDLEGITRELTEGHSLLGALRRQDAILRPRSTDAAAAAALHRGVVVLNKKEWTQFSPETWDAAVPTADRGARLEVATLRFLDPLRRCGAGHDENLHLDLWLRFVRTWITHRAAEGNLARAVVPASQRALVLASGAEAFWPTPHECPAEVAALLDAEVTMLLAALPTVRPQTVIAAMVRALAAASQTPRAHEHIAALLHAFDEAHRPGDLMQNGTVRGTIEATKEWDTFRRAVGAAWGIALEPAFHVDSVLSKFRVHATRPDGCLHPAGGDGGPITWGPTEAHTPEERYAATQSNAGEASDELLYSHPAGWLFARSGWGETERSFQQETYLSLRFGALESPGRHHDNTALTFASQGVTWLDDHFSTAPEWAGRDHHSCVEIQGRYRTHSQAELARTRDTAQCYDFWLRDEAYRPVALTRRVVYSKSGDFAVVIDQVRSRDPHEGYQRWMVPPGCRVERSGEGVVLRKGEQACHLVWLSQPAPSVMVESIASAEGEPWTRLSVGFSGRSSRLITALVPAEATETITCTRQPAPDGAVSVIVRRPRHEEQLVVRAEGSGIGGVTDAPEDLAERVANDVATGGMTPEEQRVLRLHTRAAIERVKSQLWEGPPTREQRRAALRELVGTAAELGIRGTRDHGMGAAMIDVAGTDLLEEVERHPLTSGRKRIPLISWEVENPLQYQRYDATVRTFRNEPATVDARSERQILSFDLGQITLPMLLSRVSRGTTLNVMFHGATDRGRNSLPRFERLRSMEAMSTGPTLFVSDPCLDMDATQILTWYMGHEHLNLHEFIARQAEHLAEQLGCDRILFVGNSGGGFTSLQVASYAPRSGVVTFNPQIQIDHYIPRVARVAQEVVFGESSVSHDPDLRPRTDVIARYQEIDFSRRVYIVQNTGDEMHHDRHYLPFREAFKASPFPENLHSVTPYLGPGHQVPPPDEYMSHVHEGAHFIWP